MFKPNSMLCNNDVSRLISIVKLGGGGANKTTSSAERRISSAIENKSPIFWLKCVRISLIRKRYKRLEY